MKTYKIISMALVSLAMAGCLENNGATEISGELNDNADFSVNPPATEEPGTGDTGSVDPDEDDVVSTDPTLLDGFTINKGDKLTASTTLLLDFYPPFFASHTKISEGESCVGGQWEAYADSRGYTTQKANQKVVLGVQFRDHDGRTSECYNKDIYIDQIGPEILFAKYPSTTVEEGTDVEIIFSVTDIGAGVKDVTCNVAGVNKACLVGENKVVFPKLAAGQYTLTVSATDKLNHASEKSITFTVSSLYKQLVHRVQVNQYNKVDILFVIDNSGSMEYEQKSMASRVRNFLDVVQGLDWQIAVTTTDPRSGYTGGDGVLVPLYGKPGQYILNSGMNYDDAKNTLSKTLQRSETGSGSEQGINAAYRSIERSLSSKPGVNANFIRSDAQLAVVVISDEDESANAHRNDPQNFLTYIQTAFNGQKAMSFHSIITRPNDLACKNAHGATYGQRYAQISNLTGGVIGDVCATDYAAQVQGIAEGVRKTLKSVTLTCAPVVDATRSVLVLKDGQVYNGTRRLEGLNLVFDEMLPAGNYEIYHSCVK